MGYWDDLLNTPEELALAVTATQRLDLGAILPPRLQAGTGVPLAQGLRVAATATLNGATTVVLTWYDPSGWQTRLAPFNVYVKNAVGANQAPQLVGSSYSPAKFVVQADTVASLVFVVQTVLTNGQQSTVDGSPTCTATSASPVITAVADLSTAVGTLDGALIQANTIAASKLVAGLSVPQIVAVLPAYNAITYPQGTLVFVQADNKLYRATGSAWTRATDGADIIANSIVAGSFAAGAIAANDIASAAITATKLNIAQIIVQGMTLTDNSPSAGSVAWSACTVYYNGSAYAIAGGNTASGFIYWTVGSGSFTGAASFTPGPTRYSIATNNGGTSDVAWSKLASRSIQVDNLAFSLLYGFQTQALATATVSTASAGTTNIIDVTTGVAPYGGALLTVGVTCNTATAVQSDLYLDITIDNQTTSSIQILTTGTGAGGQWRADASAVAASYTAGALGSSSTISFTIGVGFTTRCKVDLRVANPFGSSSYSGVVMYAHKITP